MPTYGQAHLVARVIDSLLRQRMAFWELIIVDDGSPDDTAAVVSPYLDDERIHLTITSLAWCSSFAR